MIEVGVVESQLDVGNVLREARERKRVQFDQAAETTRIPKRYLEALETNAPLDTYPAPLYARAFLREYAQFLGVDPEPLVQSFKARNGEVEAPLQFSGEAVPPPRRWPGRVLLSISIVLLAGIAAAGVISSTHQKIPALGGAPPASPPSTPAQSGGQPSPVVQRPPHNIQLQLHVVDRCWVRAIADGSVVFAGIIDSGRWRGFTAQGALDLTLGNAGGVVLRLNGDHVVTGAPGQVVDFAFSLHKGRLSFTRA